MKDNYENLTREDLIRLMRRRDSERKLGLVWERNAIEHENSLNNDFVALDLDTKLCIGDPPYDNVLIEGDNFDALRYLRMTCSGKVKCIYIDPPYNTGNKDFIYNDKFLDKEDIFKHSKWLEFMYRRLMLAKDLLTEDGVIFASIGDDEFGYLSVLMDEIFPGMKVGTFVWKRRSGANDPTGYFTSADHEYVICYANSEFSFEGVGKDKSGYINPDNDSRGPWTRGDLAKSHTYKERINTFYPIKNPKNDIWYPCSPDRVWAFSSESFLKQGQKIRTKTMEQLIADGKVLFPENDEPITYSSIKEIIASIKNGTAPKNLRATLFETIDKNEQFLKFWVNKKIGFGTPGYKRHLSEIKRLEKPLSTWIVPISDKFELDEDVTCLQSGMTQEGTRLIQQMLNSKAFNYPKPLSLIMNLVKQSTGPDDLILDFFAGSGTTGHAVLQINAEEQTERKFIIVSTTEATAAEPEKNICRDVTQPRLKAAINGYSYKTKNGLKNAEGTGGNMAYMRVRRMEAGHVHSKIQHDQIWYALIQMHGKAVAPYDKKAPVQYADTDSGRIIYVTSLTKDVSASIKKLISDVNDITVYSWQSGIIDQRLKKHNVKFEKIPEFLVEKFGGLR
jgi:adenine-specific DNA-methyltransferase